MEFLMVTISIKQKGLLRKFILPIHPWNLKINRFNQKYENFYLLMIKTNLKELFNGFIWGVRGPLCCLRCPEACIAFSMGK